MKAKRAGRDTPPMTEAQRLDLLIGWTVEPGEPGSNFESFEHARAVWRAHRDELVADANAGTMPHGFEVFESADDSEE